MPDPGRLDPKSRKGALLGALAGPTLVLLGIDPMFEPLLKRDLQGGPKMALWIPLIVCSWAAGVVGMPLLGACLTGGEWMGRTAARRFANFCVGGGMAGGVLCGFLVRLVPAPGAREGSGTLVRIVIADACLVAAVLLCFRGRPATPPA